MGIALWPAHARDAESLLRRADMAMYAAKQAGSGCLLYEPAHDRQQTDRPTLIGQLREAIGHEQLVLHFQPQVGIADGSITGVEALVRWRHPRRGLLGPEAFVPLAERTGLIGRLSRWVMDAALDVRRGWHADGRGLSVSVNLSIRDLYDPRLVASVEALLARPGLPPHCLGVEDERTLDLLRELGCDVVQGYVVSRRLGIEQLTGWLHARHAPGLRRAA